MAREITVSEVDQTQPILDVREPAEWAAGRARGAVHIPLGELVDRAGELPEGPIQVICRSGGRSMKAADWLIEQGRDAINIGGGTIAWHEAGLPMDADEGTPTVS
ncbi:rhodanese-like domain-containing protein [Enemella sp. A6]|uniref:rhodanese-like domain-containing protein n=1 Tax=Enemella sp. A6 TaxID=3440152 RepID=UPI003EB9E051